MSTQQVLKDMEARMTSAIDALGKDFASVRTGRASTALLDPIRVDYYGNPTPISQMASVSTPDARTLVIQPVNDGKLIRLTMPTPTEERRKQLVKQVGKMAEDARVAVRNVRREANDKVKAMVKDKKAPITEDEERRGHDQIQKTTDKFIARIEELLKKKEQEIMSI